MEDMTKVAEGFSLKPTCVYKTKYYYTVRCGKEEYRIIPTTLTEDRINELAAIKDRLFSAGLSVCDRLMPSADKRLVFEGEEGLYIMTEAVKGHNPAFENSAEILAAFAAMGDMHRVLRGCGCAREDILHSLKKGTSRLKAVKKQLGCAKRLTDADNNFVRHYPDFYALAEDSVNVLDALGFAVTCPIHGAAKEDNIFIGRNVVFADWELCRPGHFMEDTAQLISRYIRKLAAASDDYLTLDEILDTYTAHNPCNDKELAILYALVMYPKRFINLAVKFYSKTHKFTPAGVKRKFDECYDMLDFYLKYIGVR